MQILSKIEIKSVVLPYLGMKRLGDGTERPRTLRDIADEAGANGMAVMRLVGRVSGRRDGTSQYGEWVALLGDFQAVNLITGELFAGGQAFLPKIITNMIDTRVRDGEIVEIALELGVKPSVKGQTGYEYTVRPLVEPTVSPAMGALTRHLQLENKKKEE